ncbi:MAG: hypothetical protein FRX49_07260 [Trebouxia sp. A1-2]|nr:MAG: hypothetical protein FRX49_07260 [Trebouxia sp. A1-2]
MRALVGGPSRLVLSSSGGNNVDVLKGVMDAHQPADSSPGHLHQSVTSLETQMILAHHLDRGHQGCKGEAAVDAQVSHTPGAISHVRALVGESKRLVLSSSGSNDVDVLKGVIDAHQPADSSLGHLHKLAAVLMHFEPHLKIAIATGSKRENNRPDVPNTPQPAGLAEARTLGLFSDTPTRSPKTNPTTIAQSQQLGRWAVD